MFYFLKPLETRIYQGIAEHLTKVGGITRVRIKFDNL